MGRPAAIGLVNAAQGVIVEPLSTNSLSVTWDDMIRLNGYGLQVSPAALELTVNWQALRNIPTSYKVFVHVIDPATNAVVAQDDSVPRHWTRPTDTWQPNEVIADTITVPLSEVPPGKYQIYIGMYDPATGERLAISAADRPRHPDDALFIADFQH